VIEISTELNSARLNGTLSFLDSGAANAKVRIYSGVRPLFGQAGAGLMLVELVLAKPSGTVAAGTLTLAASPSAVILNTGTASWARVVNGDDQIAWDCDVTLDPGSGEVRLDTLSLVAGGTVQITLGTIA
jgi:hypothetical protein